VLQEPENMTIKFLFMSLSNGKYGGKFGEKEAVKLP
jgi:hypothetical protein